MDAKKKISFGVATATMQTSSVLVASQNVISVKMICNQAVVYSVKFAKVELYMKSKTQTYFTSPDHGKSAEINVL